MTIACSTRDIAISLLDVLFSGKILRQLHSSLKRIILSVPSESVRPLCIQSKDILSAPTRFALGSDVISLTAAQRAEWLLRKSREKQEDYLRELLRTAYATVAADAVPEHGASALKSA